VDHREAISALLRSPVFWTVSITFIGCGVTMGFIDVNLVPYMDMMGMSAPTVSTTVALLGIAEIAGGLLAGYLCDRGSPLPVLAGCYLIRGVSLVILMLAPSALAASAFGLLFGISYLGTVVASSMYIINSADPRAKGLALGLMWLMHQIGAFASSEGGGLSYSSLHTYNPVVIGSAAIAAVSFLISAVALPRAANAGGNRCLSPPPTSSPARQALPPRLARALRWATSSRRSCPGPAGARCPRADRRVPGRPVQPGRGGTRPLRPHGD
jgi:predicted MFS family arabinose efflux permease